MLAGVLIGIGVIINTTLTIPVLGALLFSFGLLVIIELKLPLFTGKIGFVLKGQKGLFLIFLGNMFGIILTIVIQYCGNPDSLARLTSVAATKFSKDFGSMFCCGVMCGMLIHFAVKAKQFYTTIMAIMIFFLIGGEHCIADIPYFIFNISLINFLKLLVVVIGNSFGAICVEHLMMEN